MVSEASADGNCCSISENCHYITVIITSIGKIKETVDCFKWRPCYTSTVAHVYYFLWNVRDVPNATD